MKNSHDRTFSAQRRFLALQDSHNRTFLCIEIKKVVFGRFSIAWLQSPLTDFGDKLGKLVIFLQRVLPYNKGNYC